VAWPPCRPQVLGLQPGDAVAALLPVAEFSSGQHLVLLTQQGVIKRTPLEAFAKISSAGLAAINVGGAVLPALLPCCPAALLPCRPLPCCALAGGALCASGAVSTTQAVTSVAPTGPNHCPAPASLPRPAPPPTTTAATAQVAEGDSLSWALRCDGGGAMMLASSDGQLLLFRAGDRSLRPTSRTAAGVQTMRLRPGAQIVSAELLPAPVAQLLGSRTGGAEEAEEGEEEAGGAAPALATATGSLDEEGQEGEEADGAAAGPWVLLVTERGMGKRVALSEFRLTGRRGVGIRGLKLKSGDRLVAAHLVGAADEVVLASRGGLMTRCRADSVRPCGRTAAGVNLMKLGAGDVVSTVAVVRAAAA
jgi:DNA gyrase/topoisomerase IV subunit A